MIDVCRGFAKCDVKKDPVGFLGLVLKQITEANQWQELKGSKALYCKIKYKATSKIDMPLSVGSSSTNTPTAKRTRSERGMLKQLEAEK